MISSQMEENLEQFSEKLETKTENLEILNLKIEATKKEVCEKIELKLN